MLAFRGMQSARLLTSIPGPILPCLEAPDWVISTGQIKLDGMLMLN